MPRLPQPGKDAGEWGTILNDFLSSSLAADGSLKSNTIGSSQLQANSVTNSAIAPSAVTAASLAPGAVTTTTLSDGAITTSKLSDGSITAAKVAADVATQVELDGVAATKLTIPTGTQSTGLVPVATSGSATAWTDLGGVYGPGGSAGNGHLVPLPGGYVAPATQTRRAMESVHMVSGASSSTFLAGNELLARWPFAVPVAPSRWRLRLSTRGSTGIGTAFTGVNLAVGELAVQTNGLIDTGRLTGTPVVVAASVTIPGNGDFVSTWVDSATFALAPGRRYAVSAGWTMPASGGWGGGTGTLWYLAAVGVTGASVGVSSQTATTGSITGLSGFNQPLLDIRVEYDYIGARPCGLVLGDSLTHPYQSGAMWQGQGWPSQVGRAHRMPMINAALNGAATSAYLDVNATCYQRLNLTEQDIDFAVLALGSNNLNNGDTADQLAVSYMALVNYVRNTIGIKHVIAVTTPPRAILGTALAQQVQPGATSIVTWDTLANGSYRLGDGYAQEVITVSASSGTGPYTLTVGAIANQHLPGEPVAGSVEQRRQDWNRYVRSQSYIGGAMPVFDMSAAVTWPMNPTRIDPLYADSDSTHPRVSAHAAYARVFPVPSW